MTTEAGEPVANAEVWADNTLAYNSNALGSTDADGAYRIELPRGDVTTWTMGGQVKIDYHGTTYTLGLEADRAPFGSSEGAVRNLVLKVAGQWPQSNDSYWGATINIHQDYESETIELDTVELVMVPDGPLIDGSQGETITYSLTGWEVVDIPIGRYTVSLRHTRPDGGEVDLRVRVRASGDEFTPTVTAVAFELLELEFTTS
ncbi:hypothetical protein ACPCG0_06935 [Propionibacteriaceae bacterium Y1923]